MTSEQRKHLLALMQQTQELTGEEEDFSLEMYEKYPKECEAL
ncbi:MAG: hypothetical protein ACI88C_000085 [Acidimicrobiales bacterium]|jgi:hypothetical protein